MSSPVMFEVVIDSQITEITAPAPSVDLSTISQPFTVVTLEGPPGVRGLPGNGAVIHGETPAGTQNGTNLVFTLANNFQAGTVSVYRNGLRGVPGYDYSETLPNQITFTTAPAADDAIVVDYYIG